LQDYYIRFQEAGAEVVALVVASLESVEGWCQRSAITYPMLADFERQVSKAYGVYNLENNGLAAPSVFIIAPDGHVAWSEIGEPSAQTILEHLP
jgi:peroxiredoxin